MFLVFGAAGACTGKPETDQSAAATPAVAAPAEELGGASLALLLLQPITLAGMKRAVISQRLRVAHLFMLIMRERPI